MSDISTRYLGLALKSPLVASASPLCESVPNIRELEDAGVGAVILPSLFEEQLELESNALDDDLWRGADSFPESQSVLPDLQDYNLGPDGYLQLIEGAKAAVDIPVIASLNGVSPGGWAEYAKLMSEAGADAIELNIYSIATEPTVSAAEVEKGYVDLVRQIKHTVRVPVAVKLSPFFSAPANIAMRLDDAGADGLVLFNRFYQPDFDVESLEVVPRLTLSHSDELLLRLHWTAILSDHIEADLAITGGVHTAIDVVKCIMAGASVAMTASALLQKGIHHAFSILADLRRWLEEHEYDSVRQMCGSMSRRSVPDPTAFERGNYMRVLSSYTFRSGALKK
ncbi:MAG TPA: dihydroorotate dehydrogenase-like protein [Candidatus Acidoferrum sp.]|nr:dihydroorotate dehydrogenase-like protein [Candidatus Acidoferrum sp.]